MKKLIIAVLLVTLVMPMFALAARKDTTHQFGRALGQFFCYNGHTLGMDMDYGWCIDQGFGRTPMGTNPTPITPAPVHNGK